MNERHRHRFEVNPEVVSRLSRSGLLFVGKCLIFLVVTVDRQQVIGLIRVS